MASSRGVVGGIFAVSVGLLAIGWIVKGDVEEAIRPDTDDFVRAGRVFIEWAVRGLGSYEAVMEQPLLPAYLLPSVVLASIYLYFSAPVLSAVALNVALFSLVVALLFRFWLGVQGGWLDRGSRAGVFLGIVGGLYVVFGLPDAFLYSYTVLTDIFFLFWITVFVVALSRGICGEARVVWWIGLLMAGSAVYVRPTGILLPILFMYGVLLKSVVDRKTPLRGVVLASLAVPTILALTVVPWFVAARIAGEEWTHVIVPGVLEREVSQAVGFLKKGVVVSERPETYVERPSGYLGVWEAVVYRIGYYLIPLRFGSMPYSVVHNVVNFVYVLLIWPAMVLGIVRLYGMDRGYQCAALFLVVVSLCYTLLHAVTLLSFGLRYQLPAFVPLWALAGVGWFTALEYVMARSAWLRAGPD